MGKWVTHMRGSVVGPRNDLLPVRRVSSSLHHVGMPLERVAGKSSGSSIPDSNGAVIGSRNDM